MGERSTNYKREQSALASRLRVEGKTWAEIGAAFQGHFKVNARVAMRLAHGMSQKDVADEWNARWPGEPKSNKNISYWEQWPSGTGHQPPLDALARLAEIYQCSVSDLLTDCGDYRHLDEAQSIPSLATNSRHILQVPEIDLPIRPSFIGDSAPSEQHKAEVLIAKLQETDFHELARILTMWAERFNPNIDRRELLFKLSNAFAVSAAAPIFDRFNSDSINHIREFFENPRRLNPKIIEDAERVVQDCRHQGDILGPQVTLQSVMAERRIIQAILEGDLPARLLAQMQTVYAELSQLTGWLLFNLGDYSAAQHYYEEARTSAHDAHNVELVTYILCTMSHLATWRGKPRVGIDHAVAAQTWALKSGSARARAYAADVAARAYAVDKQWGPCRESLDNEREALAQIDSSTPAKWWYFHDESFYWGTASECALLQRQPRDAITSSAKSLTLIDPENVHNYALTLTFQGEALIQLAEVSEACNIIVDVARLTAANTSRRIDQRIIALRGQLDRWSGSKDVAALDETLRLYRRPFRQRQQE